MVSDMYCVILAPYIIEQTAEICKNADVGFLDIAGNCYIAYESLYVEIKVKVQANMVGCVVHDVVHKSYSFNIDKIMN